MKPILWQGFQLAASFVFDFGHLQRDGTGWKSHPSLRDSSSQRGCEIVYAFSKSSISHPFWDIPSGMDFNLRMKWWFYFPSRFFKYIRHPLGWANGMENRRCPVELGHGLDVVPVDQVSQKHQAAVVRHTSQVSEELKAPLLFEKR